MLLSAIRFHPDDLNTMILTDTRFLVLAALVAVGAGSLFCLGLGGGFVLDDAQTIVTNTLVHVTTLDRASLLEAAGSFQAGGGTRPLPMLTFALDYWREGGLHAAAFKATNILIHVLTTFLVALLVRRLLLLAGWSSQRAAVCALVLALLWAVHPLQVSSVLYVVQRMQTMATLFVVLTLWAYLGLRRAEIEDRPGWRHAMLGLFFWLLALASKEDAILVPLYALVLELTVLGFRVARPERERGLRRSWLAASLLGVGILVFWVIPHLWSWEPYPGRDFNSLDRLLTQGRVLVMYLGQILVPLPALMPFNYDHLEISRGLLSPVTTVLSLLLLMAIFAWAWLWRKSRPVFSCGVLLFFAGHAVSSSVLGLEMAFEHRNHLPLIGMLLAVADLVVAAFQRWRPASFWAAPAVVTALVLVTVAGAVRAYAWGDPIRFAQHNVNNAPQSPRSWLTLGGTYFDLAGRRNGRGSPYLDRAIKAVEEGAERTGSVPGYSNVVIYKTVAGTVTQADWDRLLTRLEEVPMLPHNRNVLWTTITNLRAGIGLDFPQALKVIESVSRRAALAPGELFRIALFLYLDSPQPEAALPFFVRAAQAMPPGDETIMRLQRELIEQGRPEWARAMSQANAGVETQKD